MNSNTVTTTPSDPVSIVSGQLDPADSQPTQIAGTFAQIESLAAQPIPVARFQITTAMEPRTVVFLRERTNPFDSFPIANAYAQTWRNLLLSFWKSGVYAEKLTFHVIAPPEVKYKMNCRIWNYRSTGDARDVKNRRNNDIQFLSTDGRQHSITTAPIANLNTYNYLQAHVTEAGIRANDEPQAGYDATARPWKDRVDYDYLYRVEVSLDMPVQAPTAQSESFDVVVYSTMIFEGTHFNGGYHQAITFDPPR